MDFAITEAQERHLDGLEELERTCFSVPWTREQLKSQLPDETHDFLVAIDDSGFLLGYIGMTHVLDEGYISNVAVAPHARRQGIGCALIVAMLERTAPLELAFVSLEVRQSNAPAIALYKKHGFVELGLRKNYYFHPTENAVIMTKYLREA